MLKYCAASFLRKHGDPGDKLRLALLLGDKDTDTLVVELRELQHKDGGWQPTIKRLKGKRVSGIWSSALRLRILSDCGEKGKHIQNTVSFLFDHQNQDGGWSELAPVYIPEENTWNSDRHSVMWLTGDVIRALAKNDYSTDSRIQKAIQLLHITQRSDGMWPFHLGPEAIDTSTKEMCFVGLDSIIDALLLCGDTKECDSISATRTLVLKNNEKWQEYYNAAVTLRILLMTGSDTRCPKVQELVQILCAAQNSDGSWDKNPSATVGICALLMQCGVDATRMS